MFAKFLSLYTVPSNYLVLVYQKILKPWYRDHIQLLSKYFSVLSALSRGADRKGNSWTNLLLGHGRMSIPCAIFPYSFF